MAHSVSLQSTYNLDGESWMAATIAVMFSQVTGAELADRERAAAGVLHGEGRDYVLLRR